MLLFPAVSSLTHAGHRGSVRQVCIMFSYNEKDHVAAFNVVTSLFASHWRGIKLIKDKTIKLRQTKDSILLSCKDDWSRRHSGLLLWFSVCLWWWMCSDGGVSTLILLYNWLLLYLTFLYYIVTINTRWTPAPHFPGAPKSLRLTACQWVLVYSLATNLLGILHHKTTTSAKAGPSSLTNDVALVDKI